MALPVSERPPAAPAPKPPKPVLGDTNAAAQYRARWDTPMPISAGDERRTPAATPPPPTPPPDNPTPDEMYLARWGVEMPKTGGQAPTTGADVGALIGALTGMKAGATPTEPKFDVNAVDRAKGLLEAAQQQRATVNSDYTQLTGQPEVHGSWDAYGATDATPAPPTPADKIDRAAQLVEESSRAQRKHAIGADKHDHTGKVPISDRTDRMTQEEYDALTPEQRQAVDFNAMLVTAVRKDRHNQDEYAPTDEQRAAYDASVQGMFGKGGGSKMYAPATMSVLGQLGYQDNASDLDDFLRLKAAIKEKDLGRLDPMAGREVVDGNPVQGPVIQRNNQGDVLNPVQMDRVVLAQTLAAKTGVLQDQLAKGSQLLQTMNATAAVDRNPREALYGGVPNEPKAVAGYGAPTDASGATTMDGYFQKAIDYLADPKVDSSKIIENIRGATNDAQFQAFLAFANAKAQQAERYGVALSGVEGGRSVEEFRKLLSTIGGGA